MHFLSLLSIYNLVQSLLYFPRYGLDETTMKTWLREDNSVNIQGRIMVLRHCPFIHHHLSINQVSFQFLLYFPRYDLDRQQLWKWLRWDNSNIIQGRCMVLGSLPLIAIYLYTKFYLNANSSFKVICLTRCRTDGQSGNYMLSALGIIQRHLKVLCAFTRKVYGSTIPPNHLNALYYKQYCARKNDNLNKQEDIWTQNGKFLFTFIT